MINCNHIKGDEMDKGKQNKNPSVQRRNMTHLAHIIAKPKAGYHSSKSGKRSDREPIRKRKHKGKEIDH